MSKKIKIFFILVILLVSAGWFSLWQKNRTPSLRRTLAADRLMVGNADSADLTIVRRPVNRISVRLKGDADAIQKIRFFKEGGSSAIQFSDEWKKISGILTVPEDIPVDVLFSEKISVFAEKAEERRGAAPDITGGLSFAGNLTSVQMPKGPGGSLFAGKTGVRIKTDRSADLLPSALDLYGSSAANEIGTGSGLRTCAIGSPSLRNRCCAGKNIRVATPECAGHWVFDNVSEACAWLCLSSEESADYLGKAEAEAGDSGVPWGSGTGFTGRPKTDDPPPLDIRNPAGGSADPVSRLCGARSASPEKSQCCNDSLKNPLSLGPRPGFPDCIGTWSFNETDQLCQFRCASYEESLEIMNEIQRNAVEE